MKLAADKASMENHGLRTLGGLQFSHPVPSERCCGRLRRFSIRAVRSPSWSGRARSARAQRSRRSSPTRLNAPVAKALLGKAVLPDDSPYTTGGIGHLGTVPSELYHA